MHRYFLELEKEKEVASSMLFGNMEIKTEKKKKSIAQSIESSCLQGAAQY